MTRVLLIEDHQLIREALASHLKTVDGLELVGEAGDGCSGLALAEEVLPDLVLLDLSLPDSSGFEVLPELKRRLPACKVVVLTMHEQGAYVRTALKAGANGYLPKRCTMEQLVASLQSVLAGHTVLHPMVTGSLVSTLHEEEAQPLTPREREILGETAAGYTAADIARRLEISERTVEKHRENIQRKLGLRGIADMVRYAMEHHLTT